MSRLVCALALVVGCGPALAGSPDDPAGSRAAARAALATFSLAALPNDSVSRLSFSNISGGNRSLWSAQLRGGINPDRDSPLYLEGLLAIQQYNPVFVFPELAPDIGIDVTWSSVAATGGIGWDFELGGDWILRPIGLVSIGYVFSDAIIGETLPLPNPAPDIIAAIDGGFWAGGLGASLQLVHEGSVGPWATEVKFRHSYMSFWPIDAPDVGAARASAHQTTAFGRARHPLSGIELAGAPARLVLDGGLSLLHGDQARVLRSDWLARVGVGIEADVTRTGLPYLAASRVMVSAVVGEAFNGWLVGFGLSF